jgi:2-hydroxychromene-2-carboxylate isomerase
MPSTRTLDFYFDYLSPYAYFAAVQLPEICRSRDVALRYHPVLFAGLLNYWGQLGPAEVLPKAVHTFKTTYRYAVLAGIPYRAPRFHPFVPLTALRVTQKEVCAGDQRRVTETLFAMGWAQGRDLGDPDEIAAALDEAGLDGKRLVDATQAPEVKARLRDDTDAAIARGVFGIPTMVEGGELFWGVDQLPYLELHLDGKDPWARADHAALVTQGRAAQGPQSVGRGPDMGRLAK